MTVSVALPGVTLPAQPFFRGSSHRAPPGCPAANPTPTWPCHSRHRSAGTSHPTGKPDPGPTRLTPTGFAHGICPPCATADHGPAAASESPGADWTSATVPRHPYQIPSPRLPGQPEGRSASPGSSSRPTPPWCPRRPPGLPAGGTLPHPSPTGGPRTHPTLIRAVITSTTAVMEGYNGSFEVSSGNRLRSPAAAISRSMFELANDSPSRVGLTSPLPKARDSPQSTGPLSPHSSRTDTPP